MQVYVDDARNIDAKNAPSCTCERGQFRCHHMCVAMLHAYRHVSCTDKTCTWSRPKAAKDTEVQTIANMYPDPSSAAKVNRAVADADREALLNSLLEVNQQCALTWLMSPEPDITVCTVPTVSEIINSPSFHSDSNQVSYIMSKLAVSKEQIADVEAKTRNQQQNPLWGHYRSGRLTASNFGAVVKCMEANRHPSASLIKTLMGEYNAAGARPVQWECFMKKQHWKSMKQNEAYLSNPLVCGYTSRDFVVHHQMALSMT